MLELQQDLLILLSIVGLSVVTSGGYALMFSMAAETAEAKVLAGLVGAVSCLAGIGILVGVLSTWTS